MLVKRYPLTSYFVLAYLFTWVIEVPIMLEARGVSTLHLPHWLEALAAFGPFAAALIVLWIRGKQAGISELLRSTFRWRVPALWFAAVVLSPFIVMCLALGLTGELGRLVSGELCANVTAEGRWLEIIVLGAVLRGFGEEPGWRGFALPILRTRFGPLLATLALWPFWLFWHLPAFLMRPDFQFVAWIGFSFGILAAAAWSTLVYDRTRSVLMIALWHALINITRTLTGTASTEAFLMFAQVMTGIGLAVIVYWLIAKPGKYPAAESPV